MKKLKLMIFLIIALFNFGGLIYAEQAGPRTKIIAYYFHGSFRCITCNNMEKYIKEAIAANFKEALAAGKLEFQAVNMEERGNEHFVTDYQLYTKSLILSLVKDGKEIKSKNLNKIWEYARNKQKFIDYVTGGINEFMKDAE